MPRQLERLSFFIRLKWEVKIEIVIIIVLGTSIWVLADGYRFKMDDGQSPVIWFVGCILLWIVCFPWYLAKRNNYKLKDDLEKDKPLKKDVKMIEEKKQTNPKTGNIIAGIIILVVAIAFIASIVRVVNNSSTKSSTTGSGSTSQSKEAERPKGKVEVKSDSVKNVGYGYKSIVGEVENKTGGDVTFVQVTATFYDKDGKVVDTNLTFAGSSADTPLGNGQTAPFQVAATKDMQFDHYKLDVTWR